MKLKIFSIKWPVNLLVLVILLNITSCKKDFLNVTDSSELNRQSYVKDLNSMQEFLNGVYIRLQTIFDEGIGSSYPELVADNLKPSLSGIESLIAQYTWSQVPVETGVSLNFNPENLNSDAVWRSHYLIIRSCNFIIEDIEKYRNENPSKTEEMLGQVYAIRAMVHFKLVNIFSQTYSYSSEGSHLGIPYVTVSDISKHVTRQTVKEVYESLINDLNMAISLLPVKVNDLRFMNRTAAKGLLARVYLFRGDYVQSKSLAVEIANEVPLMTVDKGYPNDIFKNKASNDTEVLFQLRPVNYASDHSSFLGTYLKGPALSYVATNDLADLLTENMNDVRSSWVLPSMGEWSVTKFPVGIANETPALTIPETAYYPPIIRSSELFLIAAESCAKTGDEKGACFYLDAIRKRANSSNGSINVSGQALIDSIYKERRKELCFEGLRMYDLQRWKLGVHRIDVHSGYPNAKDLPYPSAKAIAPIPLQDVKHAGLTQNVGY